MDQLYSFVYRAILTEESLDKSGRRSRATLNTEGLARLHQALAFDMLDSEHLIVARRMAVIYTAIHAFENTARQLVVSTMVDAHGEEWWSKVPERIQKRAQTRMEEASQYRWHGSRGNSEIMYCDFGDLSSIIVTNWASFEAILSNMEWAKAILATLEMSRNIVMHGGVLSQEDVERIGMNIRDWIRQAG